MKTNTMKAYPNRTHQPSLGADAHIYVPLRANDERDEWKKEDAEKNAMVLLVLLLLLLL